MKVKSLNTYVGSPVERVEDLRFLRGQGVYIGDFELRRDLFLNCAHALFDVELFEQRQLLRDIHV